MSTRILSNDLHLTLALNTTPDNVNIAHHFNIKIDIFTQKYLRAVVTGASFNHFDVLVSFILNYQEMNQYDIPLFVYDLGLEKNSTVWLRKQFHFVHFRKFNFEQFPAYFDIDLSRGEYAWKPVIVKEMLDTTAFSVLWLDTGNRLQNIDVLNQAFNIIDKNGYITTSTSGTLKEWVHEGTLSYFNFQQTDKKMCNGAIVGFSSNHTDIYQQLVVTWSACALVKSCIAPPGSSRRNHRQDQAVLSVLLHQSKRKCDIPEGFWNNHDMIPGPLGIKLHQDSSVQNIEIQLPKTDYNNIWCGCKYDDDQKRVIKLKTAFICQICKTELNQVPKYLHTLVSDPDISAGGRKTPRLILFAEQHNVRDDSDMTLVMPIYNARAAVLQSLPAIFETTSGAWDLVLVLDACYDDSLDAVQKVIQENFYASSCQRVRVVEQPTAIWETSSDNLGMRISNPHKAYVLIQSDNIITEPDWNQKMWKQFDSNSKLFAVSARCAHQWDGSNQIGRCNQNIAKPLPSSIDMQKFHVRETANRGPLMLHARRTQKLEFLDEVRFFLGDDDHDLIKRASQEGWLAGYLPVHMYAPLNLSAQRNPDLKIHIPSSVLYDEKVYREFRIRLSTATQQKPQYQLTANLKPYSNTGNIGNQMFIFQSTVGIAKAHGMTPIFARNQLMTLNDVFDIFEYTVPKFGIKLVDEVPDYPSVDAQDWVSGKIYIKPLQNKKITSYLQNI